MIHTVSFYLDLGVISFTIEENALGLFHARIALLYTMCITLIESETPCQPQ